jgi:hypothetical protein
MKVATLEVELLASVARLQQDMNEAKRIVANASNEMARYAEMAQRALASLGVASLGVLAKNAIDAMDAIRDLSIATNISVEQLAGLGVAAKQTGSDLNSTAAAINKLSVNIGKDAERFKTLGITAKEPLAAFQQLSDVFVNLRDPQQRAAVMAEALGKSWAGAAPLLAEGGKKIGELVEVGSRLSGITKQMADEADAFNDKLVLLAGTGGLATRMVAPLLPLLNALADDMLKAQDKTTSLNTSFNPLLETGKALAVLFGNVAFVFRGVGTEIGGMAAQMAAFFRGDIKGGLAIGQAMKDDAKAARATFDAWEKGIMSIGVASNAAVAPVQNLGETQTKASADAAAAAAKFLGVQKAGNDDIAKHNERLRKLDNEGWVKYIEALQKEYEDGLQVMRAAADKQREEEARARAQALDGLSGSISQRQLEIDTFGMSRQAALEYSAGLLEAKAATGLLNGMTEAQVKLLQEQAALMRQLAGKEGQLDLMQRQAKANEDSFKTVFDVLQGGFRAALQGAKSFGDYIKTGLKNALYELVARPFIVQIAASLTGASGQVVSSALGNGFGGGGAGWGSMLGNLAGSAAGLWGSSAAYGAALGTTSIGAGSQAALLAQQTGVFGAQGLSATASAAGGASGQLMSTLAQAGPYIAAALAAYALYQTFRDKGENPKYRLGFGSSAQGYASDSIFGAQGFVYAQGNDSQNQGFRDAQRGTAGLDALIARGMTPAQIAAATGRLNGVQGREYSFPKGDPTASEQLLLEYTKLKYSAVFQDLDKEFADYIANFSGKSEDLIRAIGEMAGVLDALSNTSIKGLTLDALRAFQAEGESLAQTFSRVTGAFDAYSKLFVPESERNQKLFESLAEALKAQNAVLPSTREGYRALVDAQDLSTASGRELWQVLVNSAGVADTYYRTLEAGTEVVEEQIKLINKEQDLRIQLMELEGDSAGALAARREIELSTLDANSRALQLRIYHLQDEQAALERAAAASQRMANAVAGFNQAAGGRFPEYGRALAQARLDAALDKFATTAYATWTAGSATNTAVITSQVLANLRNGSLNPARALAYAQTQGPGAVEALTEVLNAYAAYEQATQQTTTAVSDLGRAASGAVDQMAGAIESLTKYLGGSLLSSLSPLTPSERLAEAERQYVENLMRAQRGDATAVAEFGAFRDAYLQEARSMYASSPEFTRIFGATYNQGAGLTAGAVGPLTGADMMRSTQSIVSALMDVQSQVATVTAAVDNLTAVTRQGDQANVSATNRVASVSAAAIAGTEAAVRA